MEFFNFEMLKRLHKPKDHKAPNLEDKMGKLFKSQQLQIWRLPQVVSHSLVSTNSCKKKMGGNTRSRQYGDLAVFIQILVIVFFILGTRNFGQENETKPAEPIYKEAQ